MSTKHSAGHFDNAWLQVDDSDDPSFFVRFLDESRTRSLEFARKHPEIAFAHLALEPGTSVLDCGCGTGDTLVIIAGQIKPGRAVGGDFSSMMIQEARRRLASTGLTNLRFEPMDVQSLPFADQSFDRVLATQLLVHVPDSRLALHEICRVTAPNGRVALADMDWDTLVVGCSNRNLGRRFTRLFSDGVRNGLVVREYAGWLGAEGFGNIQTLAQPMVFDNSDFLSEWIIEPALRHFVAVGTMDLAEATALRQEVADRRDQGHFLAASTFYTVTGQRT
jgi:ubiquinone/menaquinone biosynthesis C-methylase UbiE